MLALVYKRKKKATSAMVCKRCRKSVHESFLYQLYVHNICWHAFRDVLETHTTPDPLTWSETQMWWNPPYVRR
jgi:hypothetical protein